MTTHFRRNAREHAAKLPQSTLLLLLVLCLMQSGALAQTTIFSENFEGAWPNTWVVGNDGGVTTHKWGDNSAKKYAGSWSGFCADNNNNSANTYPNNLHTTMDRQSVSLVGYNTATLSFRCYCNTEYGYDKLTVNVKSGGTWSGPLLTLEGSSGGWQFYSVNLNAYAGLSGLTVQFRFDSDGLTTSEGVWLDDIVLSATPAGAISVTVKDVNGNVFTGPAAVSRYNSSFVLLDSKSTSGGVASWSNVPTGTYNLEVYSNGEFWGAAQTTVTQGNTSNVTIQRNEPYATAFVTKLGSTDVTGGTVLAESSLSHEVTVRNATAVSQSARVLLRVDRSQSSAYDFEGTSASQTINSGSTKTFSFSHTPVTPGIYYRYLEVQTLVSGTWVKTDTYDWGQPLTVTAYRGDLSVTVKRANGSVFTGAAEVFRFDTNYSLIDSKVPSAGNVSWSSIPQGTYNLELYSNSELWAKAQVGISGGQTSNVILQRNQPLAEFFKTSFGGNDVTGGTVYSNSALTHTIRVRNSAGLSRKTTVRLLVDRDMLPPYDFDSTTQPYQTITNGGYADFLSSHSPPVAGTYYRQLEVFTEDTPGNWVKTDSYAWGEPLTVNNAPAAFYLTNFPVIGKGLSDPIINSVFDHKSPLSNRTSNPDGQIYVFSGEHGEGLPVVQGNYPSVSPLTFEGRNPSFPGGNLVAYDNHDGIDYQGGVGNRVGAAAVGTVTAFYAHDRASDRGTFKRDCGNYLEITHSGGFKTWYLHLSTVDSRITTNYQITGGEDFGGIGGSGGATEAEFTPTAHGAHLHFALFKNTSPNVWQQIDPYGWSGDQNDPYDLRAYHPRGGYWSLANQHSVVGQVFDASGGPVAGVEVNLETTAAFAQGMALTAAASSVLHAVTSETGEYRFSGISNGATYTVSVTAPSGSTASAPQTFTNASGESAAMFSVSSSVVAPSVTGQPQSITVTLGEPVSFFVQATGSGTFSYQWRKGGVLIPGETNAEMSIAAVASTDNGSSFDAVVSNPGGSVTSNPAVLTINQPPSIAGTAPRTVKQGGTTVTWQVTVSDSETSVGALVVSASSLNESVVPTSALGVSGSNGTRTVTAIVPPNAVGNVNIRAVVTDASGAKSNATLQLTIVADSDFDGIPDSVETAAGLNPNDPSDAVLDSDGDGQSNLSEFAAGTDMTNVASTFRVLSFARNQGNLEISFTSVSGKLYRLQFCDDLEVGDWQAAGVEVIGAGGVDSLSVPVPANSTRFYRFSVQSDL